MFQRAKRMVFLKILITAIILFLLPLLFCREEKAAAQTLPAAQRYLEAAPPDFGPSPVIYTISPQAGHPGDIVNIYGENFASSQEEGGQVSFYSAPVKVISWTKEMITVVVPVDTNHRIVPVQVTNLAGGSDFIFFEYLAPGTSLTDLAIAVSPKSSYKAGQQNVRIPVTVSLTGSLPGNTTVTSQLYFASGRFPDPEDIPLWHSESFSPIYFSGFMSKGMDSKVAVINIPDVGPGIYYILADLNANYTHTDYGTNNSYIIPITESSYNNNWAIITVKITDPSDTSPVAGITLSSQGKVAYEGDTLRLSSPRPGRPVNIFFSAIRSTFTGNYVRYRWVSDNRPLSSRIGFSYFLRPGSHIVSLEVLDKYRRRATASAAIIVENGPDLSDKGPFVPTNVQQFGADGITPLAYHDITYQNIVYLRAKVLNPDGEPVKLQAELREIGDNFTGEANYESPYFVASGEKAFIALPGLIPGAYQWRVRAIDLRGNYSSWLCLDPYNAAFYLLTPDLP